MIKTLRAGNVQKPFWKELFDIHLRNCFFYKRRGRKEYTVYSQTIQVFFNSR